MNTLEKVLGHRRLNIFAFDTAVAQYFHLLKEYIFKYKKLFIYKTNMALINPCMEVD